MNYQQIFYKRIHFTIETGDICEILILYSLSLIIINHSFDTNKKRFRYYDFNYNSRNCSSTARNEY